MNFFTHPLIQLPYGPISAFLCYKESILLHSCILSRYDPIVRVLSSMIVLLTPLSPLRSNVILPNSSDCRILGWPLIIKETFAYCLIPIQLYKGLLAWHHCIRRRLHTLSVARGWLIHKLGVVKHLHMLNIARG